MNKNCILSTEQLIKVIGGMKPPFKSLFTEDKGDSFHSESSMASEFPFSENSKSLLSKIFNGYSILSVLLAICNRLIFFG